MPSLDRRLAAGLLAVLVASISSPAAACSVCGCDPAALTVGLDRPSAGWLRLGLEDRYLEKESGDGAAAEGERENRMMVRAQFALAPRLVIDADLPFYLWRQHRGADGSVDDTAHGLGDAAVNARYELWRAGGFVPRHVLAVVAGLKLPSGKNDRLGGDDPHLQLGTGSWDPTLGLWYTYGAQPYTAYAGVSGRLNTANSRGYRYGSVLTATAGVRRAFLDHRLLLSLEAQGRNAGYDTMPSATVPGARDVDPNSGGFVGYATAGAAVAITPDLLARVQVQLPVVARLHGTQSEHPVGFAGLSWDFEL
jgi:hypothetical protein